MKNQKKYIAREISSSNANKENEKRYCNMVLLLNILFIFCKFLIDFNLKQETIMDINKIAKKITAGAEEARVYVGTYAKYNNGDLTGDWVTLSDYTDY